MSDEVVRVFDDPRMEPDLMQEVEEFLGTQRDQAKAVRVTARSLRAAVNLKLGGASFDEIARVMEYESASMARMVVERAIAGAIDEQTDKTAMRAEMSLTIDQLHRAVFTKAINPKEPDQLAYINTDLKILERKSKLHGIDAPVIHYVNPSGDELQQYVDTMMALTGTMMPVEGDPFAEDPNVEDAEVVEDAED